MKENRTKGSDTIRLLLIGIGGYGENYIREYYERKPEKVKLVGICDPMAGRSAWHEMIIADKIPIHKTAEEFFTHGDADLAVISSPIHTHGAYTVLCLNHGCSVLCEKPICSNLDEGLMLEREVTGSDCFVAVGYQLSYSRDVLAIKKDILSGIFGKALSAKSVHMMRRGMNYYKRNGWAGKVRMGDLIINDSPVSNACAHQLHLLLFLLGDGFDRAARPSEAEAELYRANPNIENYDCAALRMKTEKGQEILYFTGHALKEEKIGPLSEIQFEKAVLRFDANEGKDFYVEFTDGRRIDYGAIDKGGRLQKLYDALDCVRTGKNPVCTVATSLPHVYCVERLGEMPVRDLSESVVCWTENNDTFYSVRNVGEQFLSCYAQGKLPKEAGIKFA